MTVGTKMEMRREADRLQMHCGGGRFRRRGPVAEDEAGRSLLDSAVDAARSGDDDSLRYLYLRYADSVFSYVCSILRNETDAEDVTQAVFAKLPTRLESYRRQAVPFSSWIMRVARNAAIDHVRSRRADASDAVEDARASDDSGRERLAALRMALSALPEAQREVLVMRFIGGLTPQEVAARTGRSEKSVHALQHRGRRALCQQLEEFEAAPSARALSAG